MPGKRINQAVKMKQAEKLTGNDAGAEAAGGGSGIRAVGEVRVWERPLPSEGEEDDGAGDGHGRGEDNSLGAQERRHIGWKTRSKLEMKWRDIETEVCFDSE